MKNTQVEYLLSLSSAERMEKLLVEHREKLQKALLEDSCSTSTLTTMQQHMQGSPEANAYLSAAFVVVHKVISAEGNRETARQGIMNMFCAAFHDGFAYAAALLDSAANEVIN
jgi:membrane-bound inhibitor of C-type lysozyme